MDWWEVRLDAAGDRGNDAIRDAGSWCGLSERSRRWLLILAGVGRYGVMAYFVAERRRELLQAGARRAVRLLVIGLVAGAIAAQFLTRLIASLLFGVTATDVPTYVVVFVVLSTVALVASYLPARRAARVDPIAALRE